MRRWMWRRLVREAMIIWGREVAVEQALAEVDPVAKEWVGEEQGEVQDLGRAVQLVEVGAAMQEMAVEVLAVVELAVEERVEVEQVEVEQVVASQANVEEKSETEGQLESEAQAGVNIMVGVSEDRTVAAVEHAALAEVQTMTWLRVPRSVLGIWRANWSAK